MSQFVPALQAAGFEVKSHPFFPDRYLHRYFADGGKDKWAAIEAHLRRIGTLLRAKADIMWIEKEAFPYLPATAESLVALRRTPYVIDFDDPIFHNYDQSGSGLVRQLLVDKLKPLIAGSAAIFAGNDYLADYALAAGAERVLDIPTVVDPHRYPVRPSPDDGLVKIGWIGTPANARYLAPVIAAMNALADRHALKLVTIGAEAVPGLIAPQENLPWTEQDEGELLSGIDLGVMPLVDSPWERGKCGYKLIQYMAAGKPVIASPVGVNSRIVTPEVGLLASDEREWIAAIDRLANDRNMRSAMGGQARRRVEQHYSLQAIAPAIVAAFRQITDQNREKAG